MAKKTTSKSRGDFAKGKKGLAEFRKYQARSAAQKKRWRSYKKANWLKENEAILVNLLPSIRGLMEQIEPLSAEESQQVILALHAQLMGERLTAGFVDSNEIEKLHKDMTIALMPSRLRHMGDVTDEMERLLKKAAKKGERALKKQAKEFAAYFEVPLREVYTLFYSP